MALSTKSETRRNNAVAALFLASLLVAIGAVVGFVFWQGSLFGPLQRAARDGDVEEVQRLLNSGMPVGTRCEYRNWTALHAAADSGQGAIAALLMKRGASISAVDRDGFTPLHLTGCHASGKPQAKDNEAGRNRTAALLLERGADANAQSNFGLTPLMCAANSDDAGLVELLMHYGADPSLKDRDGKTAMDRAAFWDDRRLNLLLQQTPRTRKTTPGPQP
jgi:hypothetical protein